MTVVRKTRGPRTNVPRPFLKWAGGKRQLLPALLAHAPKKFDRYVEPLIGGGALYFALRPAKALLCDANPRLIRTYVAVRDDVEAVIARLSQYPHDRDFFLWLRAQDADALSEVEVAAWMIYLNHTAYNGLYRVNSEGRFNVPFGRYVAPRICDSDNLRACATLLQGAELRCGDFEAVMAEVGGGDFVYCDPPYSPASRTASFTAYTKDGFDQADQVRLRDAALAAKRRGARVLLSNSGGREISGLYQRGFQTEGVEAGRAINSRADRRGAVPELLAW